MTDVSIDRGALRPQKDGHNLRIYLEQDGLHVVAVFYMQQDGVYLLVETVGGTPEILFKGKVL